MQKLYNTLTHQVESLPLETGEAFNLYTCGPTVYNFAHIGNFRSYIFSDLLFRMLKMHGANVKWVMNITDVDDKTIRGTLKEFGDQAGPKELKEFTQKYFAIFLQDLASLNIDQSNIEFICVSDVIPQIQEFIVGLLEKKYAYQTEDGVYFSIEKYNQDFGDYGQLVGDNFLKGKKTGARVAVDEYEKDNLSDFALWKKHEPKEDGHIFWDHPLLGKGRPGWHIECSVINQIGFKGQPTDLHTGGVDLVFPHHTNEIAQSQPFYRPFSKSWAHSEHLQVNGKKMAKSSGNYITIKDIADKDPEIVSAYRYLCLQTDFRKSMNFTWESLDSAGTALNKLRAKFQSLNSEQSDATPTDISENIYYQKFAHAIENDLGFPESLAVMWELLADKDVEDSVKRQLLLKFDEVLGVGIANENVNSSNRITPEIQKLIDERNLARKNRDFATADRIRGELSKFGYKSVDRF